MITSKTKLLCLLGSPVEHSFSPIMHNDSLKNINLDACYFAFDVKSDNLDDALRGLKAINFIGANVTIPHKVNVMKYLDFIDEKAKIIGAVNTIVNVNNKLYGYNTDIDGFIESLKVRNISLKNKTVAVLGTGGAAKGIIIGLLLEKVKHADIFSRDILKSNLIVDNITLSHENLSAKVYSDFDKSYPYDIIINTTPVGMYPNVEDSIIDVKNIGHENTVFYDLIYNPLETRFLKDAKDSGRDTINGLDMLILQGIQSFKYWFPDTDLKDKVTRNTVIKTLKENSIIIEQMI